MPSLPGRQPDWFDFPTKEICTLLSTLRSLISHSDHIFHLLQGSILDLAAKEVALLCVQTIHDNIQNTYHQVGAYLPSALRPYTQRASSDFAFYLQEIISEQTALWVHL
jgi:hypothetical protein